jgi:uncharacterized Tic20 family protein
MPQNDEHADKFEDAVPPLPAKPQSAHDDDEGNDDLRERRIELPNENRSLAVWCHWLGFLTGPLVPLILYLVEKDKRSLVAWHAREALNFQISMTIYYFLVMPMMCLFFIEWWIALIGFSLVVLMAIFETVSVIALSLAAGRGDRYRYLLTIPFVSVPRDPREDYDDRE